MEIQKFLKLVFAALCAVFTNFFGGFDVLLTLLLSLMIIDYITGTAAAAYNGCVSSKTGFRGILKKVCIISAVAVAHIIGKTMETEALRSVVIGFYAANEGISIMENISCAGVPLPEKLVKMFEQMKSKEK